MMNRILQKLDDKKIAESIVVVGVFLLVLYILIVLSLKFLKGSEAVNYEFVGFASPFMVVIIFLLIYYKNNFITFLEKMINLLKPIIKGGLQYFANAAMIFIVGSYSFFIYNILFSSITSDLKAIAFLIFLMISAPAAFILVLTVNRLIEDDTQ